MLAREGAEGKLEVMLVVMAPSLSCEQHYHCNWSASQFSSHLLMISAPESCPHCGAVHVKC